MRILFDQGTPAPLRRHLTRHRVETAYERGWSRLKNGELLDASEREGFDVLVTTDSKLRYQQRLTGRHLAIIVLTTTSWPRMQRAVATIVHVIDTAAPATIVEVPIP